MSNQSTFVLSQHTPFMIWNSVSPIWITESKSHVKNIIEEDSVSDEIFYCSDACADAVNESLREITDPTKYKEFNTIEEFLASLKQY